MKNLTRILSSLSLILVMAFNVRSQDVFKGAPVGIGTISPAQALDIAGNIKFSQALMPGGNAGLLGNILLSSGAAPSTPAWLANGTTGQAVSSTGAGVVYAAAGYWSLTGNSGTNPAVNFLGTTDDKQLRFESDGAYAGSLDPQFVGAATFGNVYLGAERPNNSLNQGAGNIDAGTYNVAFGQAALAECGANSYNIALGEMAMGANNSTGSHNIGMNWYALFFNDVGTGNIGIGYQTLQDNGGTSSYNTVIGDESGSGPLSLYSGQNNTANPTNYWGNSNAALGWGTLMFPTINASANSNTAMGYEAERNNYGAKNTAIGDSALITNSTGNNNTAVGYFANVATGALTNATAIGYQASATVNNSIALGNTSVAYNAISGAGLYLPGYNAIGSLLYTTNTGLVTSLTPGAGTSGYYLQSNGSATPPSWASVVPTPGTVTSVTGTAPITIAPATTWVVGIQGNSSGTDKGGVLYSAGAGAPALFTLTPPSAGLVLTSGTPPSSGPVWAALAVTPVWNLTGNASTTPGTNFIGTTDANRLAFKVDNVVAGTIDLPTTAGVGNNGNVYLGYGVSSKSSTAGTGTADAGTNNVAVGYEAFTGTSTRNVFVGNEGVSPLGGGGATTPTASDNVGIGYHVLYNLTSGTANTCVVPGGNNSAGNGGGAAGINQGSDNTAFGFNALANVTPTGAFNSNHNTGIGQQTLNSLYTAVINSATAVGYQSQGGNLTSHNTSMGSSANENNAVSNWTNTYGTSIGDSSLYFPTTALSGTSNTNLGWFATVGVNSLTNTTSIGARSLNAKSNSLVLGSINGLSGATANTNVCIGTNTPKSDAALAIANGHLETQGTISSVVLGSGAGTGGTSSATIAANGATDVGGEISIITGTTGLTAGAQATINFSNTYTYSPVIVISPANAAAATAMTVNGAYATSNTTGFSINFTSAPSASATYLFNYYAIETPGTSPVYTYPSYTETCVVPITITNGATAIAAGTTQTNGYQQMINVNSSLYTNENASLNNIVFTTAPPVAGVTQGTVLEAWIESGATSSSTSLSPTVYWVNLGTTGIAASGTLTIYMNIVTANVLSATGPTGEAPQLSGATFPTYGEYDNGALVFNNYWNFAEPSSTTTAPTGLISEVNIFSPPSTGAISFNNGALITQTNNWGTFIVTSSPISTGNVAETYAQQQTYPSEPSVGNAMLVGIVAATSTDQILKTNTTAYSATLDYQVTSNGSGVAVPTNAWNFEIQSGYQQTGTYPFPALGSSSTTTSTNFNIFTLGINSSGNVGFGDINYNNLNTVASGTSPNNKAIGSFYIGLQTTQLKAFFQWLRTRTYPPGGVMPTVTFSAESCP